MAEKRSCQGEGGPSTQAAQIESYSMAQTFLSSAQLLSHVQLFVTSWTAACQARSQNPDRAWRGTAWLVVNEGLDLPDPRHTVGVSIRAVTWYLLGTFLSKILDVNWFTPPLKQTNKHSTSFRKKVLVFIILMFISDTVLSVTSPKLMKELVTKSECSFRQWQHSSPVL